MKLPRWLKRTLWSGLVVLLLVAVLLGAGWLYLHPDVHRADGITYGQRGSRPLKLDVIRPEHPNGLGILMLVSGGWRSGEPGKFPAWLVAPVLRHGYTVYAIYHLSQPQSTVMEIVDDMHRAVRFVRHHAADYRIDPNRLGVTGGSAGGHLSLMLATRGGPGSPDAPDPIDRESSAVQAVAIFYPVTDLLNLGASTENLGDGGPPKSFKRGFDRTQCSKPGGDAAVRGEKAGDGQGRSGLDGVSPNRVGIGVADRLRPLKVRSRRVHPRELHCFKPAKPLCPYTAAGAFASVAALMALDDILLEAEEKMEKTEQVVVHEFSSIRTGKASGSLVENILVDVYGSHMRIRELAGITTPEPRMILIQPWDATSIGPIEKAIQKSNLGLNPSTQGKGIRIFLPDLSEERRHDLVKAVKKLAEDGRVAVRHVRRDAMEALKKEKKAGDIAEDDEKTAETEVQKLTDNFVKKIDEHLAHKEKEIMTV